MKPSVPSPIFKAIYLDVGGTLLFPDPERMRTTMEALHSESPAVEHWMNSIHRTTARLDATLPHNRNLNHDWWGEYFGTLLAQLPWKKELPQTIATAFCKRLHQDHRKRNLWSHKAEGADHLLEDLRAKGYFLGIISNSDGRVAAQIAEAGWTHHFEFIIDSEVVGIEKPDPAIFRLALTQTGHHPEEVLYVGDFEQIDRLGANRAGIAAVIIDPLRLRLSLGGWRIDHLTDLSEWLEKRA